MRPFENIRVLDLTHVLAGPFCTYQLGLLGAEVIKIESPGEPDLARGRGAARGLNAQGLGLNYQVQAANKRALALDLKTATGRDLFVRLVATADVLVQNYRTGALEALGLGADALAAINPRLVQCAITSFGASGPWAALNGYDNVIQAASGVMAATGGGGPPIKTAASMIDYATGMAAAFAIASALHQRTLTGAGQIIDCAMLDTALMFMAPEIAAERYEGEQAAIPKEAGLGVYQTRKGLLMLGAFNIRQNRRLWDLLSHEGFAALDSWEALWTHAEAMRAELTRRLLERDASQWETELNRVGVPAQRVRDLGEALALPHVELRDYLQTVPAPEAEGPPITVPSAPFRFAHDGPRIATPPPRLGQDTNAILGELGLGALQIAALRSQGVIA